MKFFDLPADAVRLSSGPLGKVVIQRIGLNSADTAVLSSQLEQFEFNKLEHPRI